MVRQTLRRVLQFSLKVNVYHKIGTPLYTFLGEFSETFEWFSCYHSLSYLYKVTTRNSNIAAHINNLLFAIATPITRIFLASKTLKNKINALLNAETTILLYEEADLGLLQHPSWISL